MADPEAVVRAYFDAWNRRDVDAFAATLEEGAVWHRSADFPEGRALQGRAGIVEFARSMWDMFAETPIELGQVIQGTEGRVAVSGTSRFRSERSGAETTNCWTRVYAVQGDAIRSVTAFADLPAALEAAEAQAPG